MWSAFNADFEAWRDLKGLLDDLVVERWWCITIAVVPEGGCYLSGELEMKFGNAESVVCGGVRPEGSLLAVGLAKAYPLVILRCRVSV